MSIVDEDEILAVQLSGELVCAGCLKDKDTKAVNRKQVIDQSDLELGAWFFL